MPRTRALSGLLCLVTCPLTEPSAVTTPSGVASLASPPLRYFPAWLTLPLPIAPAHFCRQRRCCSARNSGRTALQHGTGRKRRREACSLQYRGATAGWQVPVIGERGWANWGGDGDCSSSSSSSDGLMMIRWGNGRLETQPLLGVEGGWGSPALRCGAGGASESAEDTGGREAGVSREKGFLREALGMTHEQAQRTIGRCEDLQLGVATEVVAFCTGGGLGLSTRRLRAMVVKNPSILEAPVSERLAPQVDRWLQGSGLGLTRDALGAMSVSCPEVLLLDYDSILHPIVVWLMVDVGLPRNRVAQFVASCPRVLASDLEMDLWPRKRWLTDVLELESKEVRRLLTLAPDLLHASMEETLSPACDWLMGAAGCDMPGVGQILARSPELALMDPDLMEHNFNRMCTDLCEGDTEQASALLLWKPFLLPQSERLAPLVRLMTEDLQATLSQARETIANEPSFLEFQLERLVYPRLEAVRKAGIGDVVNGSPLALGGKMKVLGSFSEARFAKWLKRESRSATVEAVGETVGGTGGDIVGEAGERRSW